MKPTFFATQAAFRKWMEKHHEEADELLVGFYKTGSGKASMTWPESVEVALCFGWIDAVRKSIDESSYTIRFCRRRARSFWSAVNIKKVAELTEKRLMHPAGLAAFEQRTGERSGVYSFEQSQVPALTPELQERFRTNLDAWEFFQKQPPWYRKTAAWWVVSAKKEETKWKRLAKLMECSAAGKSIKELERPKKS
jgi:uncharacterized protein YdeI (YjbR/CyaY-like superfamily)